MLPSSYSQLRLQRMGRAFGIALPLMVFARGAMAQAVSGAIDPATGLANLAPYFLGLAESAMVLIAAWKGGHAFAEGRSMGPAIIGFIGGTAIAFGGYYIMSKYGVTASTDA